MKLQFKVVLKSGTKVVAEAIGLENRIDGTSLTIEDVVEKVVETEQFLEKLTGLRVHIEQLN